MFEYYWDIYKKYMPYLLAIIIIVASSIYYIEYIEVNKNVTIEDRDIWIKIEENKVILKIDIEQDSEQDFYQYQAYIYPSEFTINCNSNDEKLCTHIISNKEKISTTYLWFSWWDINNTKDFTIDLNDFFTNIFKKESYWENLIDRFHNFEKNLVTINEVKETWFEKYFEFKKVNNVNKILLNNLEIECVQSIVDSMIEWDFWFEEIVKEKVIEQCSMLASDWENNFFSLEEEKKKAIEEIKTNIEFNITKVKVKYSFLKKQWLSYEIIEEKEINIDRNEKINIELIN